MRTLAVIPARGGSKGLPRKNIRLLGGKPLIAHTIEAALASIIDRTVVSTDDSEIADVARSYGAEVLHRPPDLARDDTPTLPVLRHALEACGGGFDAVVTLQPTSPLRSSHHIDEALRAFASHTTADSMVSVVRVPHHMTPGSLMRNVNGLLVHYDSAQAAVLRRQDKAVLYARNGAAIYVTRTETLPHGILGQQILPYLMDKATSIDIDDAEDFALAEAWLAYVTSRRPALEGMAT